MLRLFGCSAALLTGTLGAAPAAPASDLTLQAALASTLEHSPALKVQRSVVEQKSGLLDQAGGAFDWTATGTITYTRDRTPVPGAPGTSPVDRTNTTAYTTGLGRLFRNGIYVQPSASVGVADNASPASPTYGTSALNIQILVPLLRGLGRDSTGAAEAAARGDVEVARLLYQHALSAEAFATATNYWSSRSADEVLGVQRDVELAAEKLVASTKVLVHSGVFPPAYLLQAEANLRDKRTVRINAELDAHQARFNLGQSLGLRPEEIGTTPTPTDDFPPLTATIAPFTDQTRSALIVQALQQRADYRASQQSLVPLNILARQAELDLKPQLDLSANLGYKGLNAGNSLTAPMSERLTGANAEIGLSLAWPFRNAYQRGLLRERRANQTEAEAQTEQLAQSVANQVLLALEQLRLRADAVRSAQETVDIAKRALDAQYEQVKAGTGTILDLINLENLSSTARIRYVTARASYAIAIVQLRYALGSIFQDSAQHLTLANLTTAPDL